MVCLLVFAGALSCSGGSPVVPVTERLVTETGTGGNHHLWGYWQVSIDGGSELVEITEVRQCQFHVNVVMYLQPPSPMGIGIKINSSKPEKGEFDLTVSLTHPFSDPTYTGFDVKGIFIATGTRTSKYDSSLRYAGLSEARLLNADGYTRWWNPAEFTSPGLLGYTKGALGNQTVSFQTTLNPYKVFADDLQASSEFTVNPAKRASFTPAKKTNYRRYIIRFPLSGGAPQVVFNYAVDACWEQPAGNPLVLSSFPPEANQAEPYKLTYEDKGSTAYFVSQGQYGGDLKFRLGVFKHGGTTNQSWVETDLDLLVLESPTLFPDPVLIAPSDVDEISGDGAFFDVQISGVQPTSTAGQEILVHAIMKEKTYNQGFGVPAPEKPLAAYQVFSVPILSSIPKAAAPSGMTADVTRSPAGKLNGITLNWNDVPGAAEYVVYWSNDPYQYDEPLKFTEAPGSPVADSQWQYSVPANELNGQWMFQVTARLIPGNAGTESQPSSRAMVDFSAVEELPEGKNEWRRRYNVIRNRFIAANGSTLGVEGSGALVLSPNNYFIGRAICYNISPALPTNITGATTCFIEFAHNRTYAFPTDYAYSVCTRETQLPDPDVIDDYFQGPLPQSILTDYKIDMVDANQQYLSGVKMNLTSCQGIAWHFNDPATEAADPSGSWGGAVTSGFVVSRYSLPKVISQGHAHAGICFGGKDEAAYWPISPPVYPLVCDEIALVIY